MRDLALLSLFKSSAVVEYCLDYRNHEVENELWKLENDEFFESVKEILYNALMESDLETTGKMFKLHPDFLYEIVSRKEIKPRGSLREDYDVPRIPQLISKESGFRVKKKVNLSELKTIYTSESIRHKYSHKRHPSLWPSVSKDCFFSSLDSSTSKNSSFPLKQASSTLQKAWDLIKTHL